MILIIISISSSNIIILSSNRIISVILSILKVSPRPMRVITLNPIHFKHELYYIIETEDLFMTATTTRDFQQRVLNYMTFTPHTEACYTLYKNDHRPELGYFMLYSREGYYDFGVGDYTIANNFSLAFNHQEELMRFGTVYTGETKFTIEDSPVSSFTPSSFFIIEKGLKGTQSWTKGTHFHGAEITIHQKYFDEIIKPAFPEIKDFSQFITNYTYRYLPLEIATIIQTLRNKAEANTLTALYLESKILECIALLHNELQSSPQNVFTNQLDYGEIKIGTERYISLTATDAAAIQKAHAILTEEAFKPPTIKDLSQRVLLNEQKLKAGFSAKYHMSISQYTTSLRMTKAANLLSTTELSVEEIAKEVGYHYSGNFVKMFKKVYGKTPLAFRKMKL